MVAGTASPPRPTMGCSRNTAPQPPRSVCFVQKARSQKQTTKPPIYVTTQTSDAFDCSNFTQAAQDNKENDSEHINGKLAALASS